MSADGDLDLSRLPWEAIIRIRTRAELNRSVLRWAVAFAATLRGEKAVAQLAPVLTRTHARIELAALDDDGSGDLGMDTGPIQKYAELLADLLRPLGPGHPVPWNQMNPVPWNVSGTFGPRPEPWAVQLLASPQPEPWKTNGTLDVAALAAVARLTALVPEARDVTDTTRDILTSLAS
ncbi:hypothetical protein FAIPA1_130151 [Frankia sp. AiPs1]|uniref:hypothetical protein n=1 Tax=Frankia sp. AiPa1 TaxID=573492 RepID=UPI00202AC87B|nr:hypothetical protein [Frankia sp. AiPa1]MCL9761537.1 hypothetical protein [Frankia sp. AiPa1]